MNNSCIILFTLLLVGCASTHQNTSLTAEQAIRVAGADSTTGTNPTVVDLYWPNLNTYRISSGKVRDAVDVDKIQKVIIVKAVSSAPVELLAGNMTWMLAKAGDFVSLSDPPSSFWLTAIVITSDQKHFLVEISHDTARLTTETGHGFFKLPKP